LFDEAAGELEPDLCLFFGAGGQVDLGGVGLADELVEGEAGRQRCFAVALRKPQDCAFVDAAAVLVAAVELAQERLLPGVELEWLPVEGSFGVPEVVREEPEQLLDAAAWSEAEEFLVEARAAVSGPLPSSG